MEGTGRVKNHVCAAISRCFLLSMSKLVFATKNWLWQKKKLYIRGRATASSLIPQLSCTAFVDIKSCCLERSARSRDAIPKVSRDSKPLWVWNLRIIRLNRPHGAHGTAFQCRWLSPSCSRSAFARIGAVASWKVHAERVIVVRWNSLGFLFPRINSNNGVEAKNSLASWSYRPLKFSFFFLRNDC